MSWCGCNSALGGSRSAAQTGGPALGGALVSLLSAPVANGAGALLFAASFLSIRRIRRREATCEATCEAEEQASDRTERTSPRLWPRIREGLQLVRTDALLRTIGVATALYRFSFAALLTVLLLFLPRELHLSATAVGLVLAAVGPGAVLGSLLAAKLPGRWGYGRVMVGAAVLGDGVLLCVPALHGSAWTTVLALIAVNFLFGMGSQTVNVTAMAVRQARTPVRLQGRGVATINVAGMGLTPLGSLLGGQPAQCWGCAPACW